MLAQAGSTTNHLTVNALFTAVDEVDWRAYAATKGLSEKQQKIADKVSLVCSTWVSCRGQGEWLPTGTALVAACACTSHDCTTALRQKPSALCILAFFSVCFYPPVLCCPAHPQAGHPHAALQRGPDLWSSVAPPT